VGVNEAVFSVDTHLFRELGDLLVGRDSTALFELIKNAYDADASEVTVIGTNLDNPEAGEIAVADNGCGMDQEVFREGFLRIASRLKDIGDRRSETYYRPFTGAKGIGRLSAHKLAKLLQVESVRGMAGGQSRVGIFATIDWDAIEAFPTLEQITEGREVIIRPEAFDCDLRAGTRIVLRRLRRRWTPKERVRFVEECRSFGPPDELTTNLVPRFLSEPLIFRQPTPREKHANDPGFVLNLEGEFTTGENLWPTIVASSQWVIEVDAARPEGDQTPEVKFGIGPTKTAALDHPSWGRRIFTTPRPKPATGPYFQARIFLQVDPKGSPSDRRRIRGESGIKVYVEGFRILPYGEPGNDWLSLDANYSRRSNLDFGDVVSRLFGEAEEDEHWEELHLANRSYFGGVFLTQEGAAGLRPLINREGFLPDPAFEFLRNTVRQAIDLGTRVRAAATFREREAARAAKTARRGSTATALVGTGQTAPSPHSPPMVRPTGAPPEPLQVTVDQVTEQIREARDLLVAGNVAGAGAILTRVPEVMESISDTAERIAEEGPMIRVLASVGTQMSAFVHEIRSLLSTASAVEESIERLLAADSGMSDDSRRKLSVIRGTIGELRRYLERQASYLTDIVTPDARRRRSRQNIAERFESGVRLLRTAAERRRIEIANAIPTNLKSPPMFPAELTSVFSNLISNAIKAAGPGGRVLATGDQSGRHVIIRVENTGSRVDLANAEHWFRPFESSTTDVDSYLGQGMGLGLTITRNMLEPYGATIRFVEPSTGSSTALEIVFPG